MRILAINGSPHRSGNTIRLIDEILRGARANGHEGETVHVADLRLDYCDWCGRCNAAGICPIEDGFPAHLEQIKRADVLVVATPASTGSVTGYMKNWLDRVTNSQLIFEVDEKKQVRKESRLPAGKQAVVVVQGCTDLLQATVEPINVALSALEIPVLDRLVVPGVGLAAADTVDKRPDVLQRALAVGQRIGRPSPPSAAARGARIPPRLRPGDTVGIISPSSPVTAEAVGRMVAYFEGRGFRVKVAPNALASFGFLAGTPQQRADDLNLMLRDPEVRMVMTSMGGAGAAHLLPLVDYPAMAADPKIVVGLSNPSILLNAITSVAGVPTFHGPNGVQFGGYAPLTPYCEDNLWPLIGAELALPYAFPVRDSIRVLRAGPAVEGPLYGGHLRTNQVLLGTPWEPDWKGALLFLEEDQVELYRTDAMLAHLRLAGVFDAIKGLIVGRPVECDPVEAETLDDIVLRNCAGYDFPIVADVPIGHTDDKLTLPIGCRALLDTREPCLALVESPTC